MDKVSVIIPVYNAEKYLGKCLDSIINQTYKNLEIILIDDGSTDNSSKICDKYACRDDRIIVIHNNNKGVSSSRNYGIEISTGKYILFIDSDDTVDNNYVYYLLRENKNYEYDIVYCIIRDIYDYGDKYNIKDRYVKENMLLGDLKRDYYFLFDLLKVPFVKLYKSEIVKKYNIFFPEDIFYGEDQFFNFKYHKYVKKYKLVNLPLYNYYHRQENSLSKTANIKTFRMTIKKLKEEKQFLNDMEINDKETIIYHQVINAIKAFAILEDDKISYEFSKKRIRQLSSFLEKKYRCITWKKYIFQFLLNRNFYLPIYLYCLLRYLLQKK